MLSSQAVKEDWDRLSKPDDVERQRVGSAAEEGEPCRQAKRKRRKNWTLGLAMPGGRTRNPLALRFWEPERIDVVGTDAIQVLVVLSSTVFTMSANSACTTEFLDVTGCQFCTSGTLPRRIFWVKLLMEQYSRFQMRMSCIDSCDSSFLNGILRRDCWTAADGAGQGLQQIIRQQRPKAPRATARARRSAVCVPVAGTSR